MIWVSLQLIRDALSPLWTHSLHYEYSIELLVTPLRLRVQGYLSDFLRTSGPALETRKLVPSCWYGALYFPCQPSMPWASAPSPATSWLYLWAWYHGSCHGQGLHPCPCRGSGWIFPPSLLGSHCSWEQALAVVLPTQFHPHQQCFTSQLWCQMGQKSRWASSLAVFHPAECFTDQGSGHTGSGRGSWRDLRESLLPPLFFVSEHKVTSINAYTVLTRFVRSICLVMQRAPSPSRDTVANSCFSASDFASQMPYFTMHLASMWGIFACLAPVVLPPRAL